MLSRIVELADLLRKQGLRVSTAEVEDAARAARLVGPSSPDALRQALAATLVKSAAHRPLFDELFDLTFRVADGSGPIESLAELLAHAGVDSETSRDLVRAAASDIAELPAVGRMALGMNAVGLPGQIRQAADAVGMGGLMTPLQVGFYTQRVLDAMDLAAIERDLGALLARLAQLGLDDDAAGQVGQVIAERLDQVRRQVRRHVERELRRRHASDLAQARVDVLASRPLVTLTNQEIVELRAEVERLARILRARTRLRPVRPRRGRLDVRRTLRASMATGGVPVQLHLRQRRPRKPRLVILCDISDSVRQVSRFLLELVYALSAQFDRVSSFAFVAELGELTQLFRDARVDRAIEQAYAGAVVNVFANSNYGRVLAQFTERHLGLVSRKTTVLVIGDGRNNYHPSRADCLAAIHRKARQVIWLNPESPPVWGFGDSAMIEYVPHCDRVCVARDLNSLREVVDELVRPRRRARKSPFA